MKQNNFIDLIYKEIDSELSSEEKNILHKEMKKNPDLADERKKILKVREMITGSAINSFKPFFEEKVMSKINALDGTNELDIFGRFLTIFFKRTAFVSAFIILLILILNVSSGNILSVEAALGLPEMTINEIFDPTTMIVME